MGALVYDPAMAARPRGSEMMSDARRHPMARIFRTAAGTVALLLLAPAGGCEQAPDAGGPAAAPPGAVREVEGRFAMGDTEADWIARFDGDTLLSIAEERRMGESGSGRAEFFFEDGRLVRYQERSRRRLTDPGAGGALAAVSLRLEFAPDGSLATGEKTVDGASLPPDDAEVAGIRSRADALVEQARQAEPAAPPGDGGGAAEPDGEESDAGAFLRPDGIPLEALAYDCQGTEVVTVLDAGTGDLVLSLRGARTALPHVPSASGARFSDGTVSFWNKGREALLEVGDGVTRNCVEDRVRSLEEDARHRGLAFRGVGNEPPWILEMGPRRVVLLMGYEKERLAFDAAPPRREQQGGSVRHFSLQSARHALELTLSPGPCPDTMADRVYPTTVAFILDETGYRGCGRDLT
jgi:uncharacterized membrane protein/membrane-bound inhibitor of C-type lysozyme